MNVSKVDEGAAPTSLRTAANAESNQREQEMVRRWCGLVPAVAGPEAGCRAVGVLAGAAVGHLRSSEGPRIGVASVPVGTCRRVAIKHAKLDRFVFNEYRPQMQGQIAVLGALCGNRDAVVKAHDGFLNEEFLLSKVVDIDGDTQPKKHCKERDRVNEGERGDGSDCRSASGTKCQAQSTGHNQCSG
jgi:hypothetical protein